MQLFRAPAAATLFLLLRLLSNSGNAFTLAPFIESSYQHALELPKIVTYPTAFIAAFRTGAAISVANHPRMPPIESTVGSCVTRLPSGSRVRLFFPTNSTESSLNFAPYCTNGRQTSNGMASLVGLDALGLSFLLGHLADASSGCIANAKVLGENLPLLIYSHGYGGNMDMSTYFFRKMASNGMVVAALEHTDGTASSTVLEDGSERRFNEYYMTGRQQLTRRASELLEAVEFLPKYCNFTVGKIMLGGHSYGGASAVMAANGSSEQANIAGLILHDPALGMGWGILPPNGARSKIPTISYISDEYNKGKVRYGDLTLHVKGAFHGNFVDAPLWAPRFVMRFLSLVIPAAGPADALEVHHQLADSAMSFMKCQDPQSDAVKRGDLFETVQ